MGNMNKYKFKRPEILRECASKIWMHSNTKAFEGKFDIPDFVLRLLSAFAYHFHVDGIFPSLFCCRSFSQVLRQIHKIYTMQIVPNKPTLLFRLLKNSVQKQLLPSFYLFRIQWPIISQVDSNTISRTTKLWMQKGNERKWNYGK